MSFLAQSSHSINDRVVIQVPVNAVLNVPPEVTIDYRSSKELEFTTAPGCGYVSYQGDLNPGDDVEFKLTTSDEDNNLQLSRFVEKTLKDRTVLAERELFSVNRELTQDYLSFEIPGTGGCISYGFEYELTAIDSYGEQTSCKTPAWVNVTAIMNYQPPIIKDIPEEFTFSTNAPPGFTIVRTTLSSQQLGELVTIDGPADEETISLTYTEAGEDTLTLQMQSDQIPDDVVSRDFEILIQDSLSPDAQINNLANLVMEINLNAGISNSLNSKLDTALGALDDVNTKNDGAALNSMYAFCNSVSAQRGKKLSGTQADQLIAAANGIIASLNEFAPLFCE